MKTNWRQNTGRILLGIMLLYTGTGHLSWARQEFTAQVPDWVPLNDDLVVVISGIVELAIGTSLIFFSRYKMICGWIAALFFIAVFPGNIAQYVNGTDAFGLNSDFSRGMRLFFQPLFIAWALWSTNAWKSWRKKSSN